MLQALNLLHCGELTDTGLDSLAEGSGMLMALYLKGCDVVTETGLAHFIGRSVYIFP